MSKLFQQFKLICKKAFQPSFSNFVQVDNFNCDSFAVSVIPPLEDLTRVTTS